jgi:hypothetical protein
MDIPGRRKFVVETVFFTPGLIVHTDVGEQVAKSVVTHCCSINRLRVRTPKLLKSE